MTAITEDEALTGIPLLRVTTTHSVYEIDQEAGTYTRWPVHPDAADFTRHPGYANGHERPYDELFIPHVGNRMTLIEPGGTYVRSTPIVSIEPVERAAR